MFLSRNIEAKTYLKRKYKKKKILKYYENETQVKYLN